MASECRGYASYYVGSCFKRTFASFESDYSASCLAGSLISNPLKITLA
jgi:hypothetical protein